MTTRTSGARARWRGPGVGPGSVVAAHRGVLPTRSGASQPASAPVELAREPRPRYHADDPGPGGGGSQGHPATPLDGASGDACAAAEAAGPGTGTSLDGTSAEACATLDAPALEACAALEAALDLLDELPFDAHTTAQMRAALTRLQPSLDRLVARRDAWIGGLRRAERAAAAPGRERAGDRSTDEFLTDDLLLAPAEAKKVTSIDRQLDAAPAAREAFGAGTISRDHAGVIAQALLEVPFDVRPDLEAALLDLATTLHPVALRREAARLIAAADHASAERTARLQHARRRASWRRDLDGGLVLNAKLFGVQAEVAETALQAATPARARSDDGSDDNRRADALVGLLELALRAGELPAQHGIAPQVLVTVSSEDLARGFGTATLGSGAVVPLTEAATLLTDCVLTRIVLDARGAPTEASEGARTVPRALWKQLLVRDRTCVWDGCTMPSAWLQVAHGDVPFGAGGTLSIDTCALLCPAHHRRFDSGGWRLEVDGVSARVVRDPTRPPVWSVVAASRRSPVADGSGGPRSATRSVGRSRPAARSADQEATIGRRPSGDPPLASLAAGSVASRHAPQPSTGRTFDPEQLSLPP